MAAVEIRTWGMSTFFMLIWGQVYILNTYVLHLWAVSCEQVVAQHAQVQASFCWTRSWALHICNKARLMKHLSCQKQAIGWCWDCYFSPLHFGLSSSVVGAGSGAAVVAFALLFAIMLSASATFAVLFAIMLSASANFFLFFAGQTHFFQQSLCLRTQSKVAGQIGELFVYDVVISEFFLISVDVFDVNSHFDHFG